MGFGLGDFLGIVTNPVGSLIGAVGGNSAQSSFTNASDYVIGRDSTAANLLGNVGGLINDVTGATESMRAQQEFALQQMAQQQQYNLENMEKQNQYNIDAFNRENAYNTPAAQRARMSQAGLNPNWDISGGQVAAQQQSGVSSSNPSASGPSAQMGNLPGLIGAAVQLGLIKSQKKNIDADTHKKEAETDNIVTLTPVQKQEMLQNIKYLSASERKAIADAHVSEEEVQFIAEKAYAEIAERYASAAASGAEVDYKEAMINEINTLLQHRVDNLDAQTAKAAAEAIYTGVLSSLEPVKVRIRQQEANAQTEQARSARIQATVAREIGTSQIKLNAFLGEESSYRSAKTLEEASGQWIHNQIDGLEYAIAEDLAKEGYTQRQIRSFIDNIESDSELKQAETEFTKAKTKNEKREVWFKIADVFYKRANALSGLLKLIKK